MFDIYIDRNKRYKVDDLYQWDTKVGLNIHGLNLVRAPEIHFSNSGLKEAIVKQSTMDINGIISVKVPDSVLQVNGNLDVYIYAYESEESRTLYQLAIKVIGRKKPADYIAEDDEKIYSYNALENKVDNTVVELTRANEEALAEVDRKIEEFRLEIADSIVIVKGSAEAVASLLAHLDDKENPHETTAQQVGAPTVKQFDDHTKAFNNHTADKTNPHAVTASQVGAPTVGEFNNTINAHKNDKNNPHGVTASQVGAFRVYTTLEQLGLTKGATVSEIIVAMPNYTEAFFNVYNWSLDTGIPQVNGALYIRKWTNNRTRLEFYDWASSYTWFSMYVDGIVRDWINVDSVKKFLPLTGGTLTGNDFKISNGFGRFFASDYTFMMEHTVEGQDDTGRGIMLSNQQHKPNIAEALKLISFESGSGGTYNIFGEHNITCGTADLTAGTSALTTGCYYDVYE